LALSLQLDTFPNLGNFGAIPLGHIGLKFVRNKAVYLQRGLLGFMASQMIYGPWVVKIYGTF